MALSIILRLEQKIALESSHLKNLIQECDCIDKTVTAHLPLYAISDECDLYGNEPDSSNKLLLINWKEKWTP